MVVETRPAEIPIIEASNLHIWQDYLKASPLLNGKTKSVDTAFLQINTGQGFLHFGRTPGLFTPASTCQKNI